MSELATADSGAKVVMATSFDPKHPPAAVIDGKENSFWMTTGMFPQEIVIGFPSVVNMSKVKLVTRNVRGLVLEKCDSENVAEFTPVTDIDMPNEQGRIQHEQHVLGNERAKFLKLKITSGYDDFVAIHRVSVMG
eukprot:TRINITY_DN5147_c0_g2_i1.p1 TRINITY_DN5147_c0_g2~~TRINITY_DN5147_c0_g2_i1.p1  ORF type:complete len:135 (+),score=18.48 TRINITY_DN5147_c0_g2_i1:290-694(+)